MGLSIRSGPDFVDDSHGYVNRDTTEMTILDKQHKTNILTDNQDIMYSNPKIDQERDCI